MYVNGELIDGLSNGTIENPHASVTSKARESESRKVPLSSCSQAVGDRRKCQWSTFENTRLVVTCCHEQWYGFPQSPRWVNADRAQYERSSSGLITIVVMPSFNFVLNCQHSIQLLRSCREIGDETDTRWTYSNDCTDDSTTDSLWLWWCEIERHILAEAGLGKNVPDLRIADVSEWRGNRPNSCVHNDLDMVDVDGVLSGRWDEDHLVIRNATGKYIKHIMSSTSAHLRLWRKLYNCSLRHFTTSHVFSNVLYWHFRRSPTV